MEVKEVTTEVDKKNFLEVARLVYHSDENFVCPLDSDIEAVFDSKKNSFHTHGEIARWIVINQEGALLGRVAAFINYKKAHTFDVPTGGMGFFESVKDYQVARILFQTAESWLKDRGMLAVIGPVNFGENDTFWGLLVEGFSRPSYGMNYHLPYYKDFFEQYGFQKSYEQISHKLYPSEDFPSRFTKIANWVLQRKGFEFIHFSKTKLDKFAKDMVEIYNDAWVNFNNFAPLTEDAVLDSFQKMKIIVDEKLIWFAYFEGEPVAFVVIIPDINPMIKELNGNLNWWGKIRFMYNKIFIGTDRIRAVVMGTKKKFQNHGLESALLIKLKNYVVYHTNYKELEISWVGDFNAPMLALQNAMEAEFARRHITYIKKIV